MFEKLTVNKVKCSQYKLGVSNSTFLKNNSKNRYLAELAPDTHPPTHSLTLSHMYRFLMMSSPYNSQL
jgi:hypothetical protein